MRESINISLPEPLKEWVQQQVTARGYATVSEFVRHLLREEQRRQIDDNLHAALDSGEATPMTAHDWERIRREGQQRLAAKRKKR